MEPIHDRMPVILHPEDYDLWLDPDVRDPDALKPLLRSYPSEEMIVQPVNPKVNKAGYDASDCVEVVPVKRIERSSLGVTVRRARHDTASSETISAITWFLFIDSPNGHF